MTLPDCLAIDPGPEACGVVRIRGGAVVHAEQSWAIDSLPPLICAEPGMPCIIESLSNYGSPVGDETLRTAYAIGRLAGIARDRTVCIKRLDVKVALLGTSKGTDSIIRQNILERFGGPQAAKKGGPLASVRGHAWQALALAVAYGVMLDRGDVKKVRMP